MNNAKKTQIHRMKSETYAQKLKIAGDNCYKEQMGTVRTRHGKSDMQSNQVNTVLRQQVLSELVFISL